MANIDKPYKNQLNKSGIGFIIAKTQLKNPTNEPAAINTKAVVRLLEVFSKVGFDAFSVMLFCIIIDFAS